MEVFDAMRGFSDLLTKDRITEAVVNAGQWLLTARKAACGAGVGFRDIIYYRNGRFRWLYPHSNMGEHIETYLDLYELTGDERFREGAVGYADGMASDPVKGIYQGEVSEAVGLTYYWRDVGSYTGMYSMRAVAPFWRLGEFTGKLRYYEIARMIAGPLLRDFNPLGIPRHFAWTPDTGFFDGPNLAIGCRVGYLVGTYAFCEKVLQDPRGCEGRNRLLAALDQIQNPDGSFPQTFLQGDGTPSDPSIKNHFFGYILNGLATCLELFPDDVVARRIAIRLADFIKKQVDYFGMVPYCGSADNPNVTDQAALFYPVIDPAPALLRLSVILNRPDYRHYGERIWLGQWMRQVDAPHWPEAHGALPSCVDPLVKPSPKLAQYRGVDHLKEDPDRVACAGSYYMNQFIQAGVFLLKNR